MLTHFLESKKFKHHVDVINKIVMSSMFELNVELIKFQFKIAYNSELLFLKATIYFKIL